MRLAFAVLIAMTLRAAPAFSQVVDLSTIKCKEFLDSNKETIGYIMMWLDGYFTSEDDPAVSRFRSYETEGREAR
jgi:acid stress chaperone HdeB